MTDAKADTPTTPAVDPALAELQAAAETAPKTHEEAVAQIAASDSDVAQRPDDVPEKFWDAEKGEVRTEELLKSYSELEKGSSTPEDQDNQEAPEPKGDDEGGSEAEDKGGDEDTPPAAAMIADLTATYQENGEFSEEDYAKAEALGFSKEVVDGYAAGQQAIADEASRRITEAAGGKDNMDRMFAWASTSLNPDEIKTFNASFEGSDANAAVLAMEGLKSKYRSATGTGSKLLGGKPAGQVGETFKSQAEVTAAMSDSRYTSDPAYRNAVGQKLLRSHF